MSSTCPMPRSWILIPRFGSRFTHPQTTDSSSIVGLPVFVGIGGRGNRRAAMRFAADRTLGRLVKWLRLLGYDTLYFNNKADEAFMALADQGRILLSRSTGLARQAESKPFVFVRENDPRAQLRQVVRILDLRPDPAVFFSRCTLCNGGLVRVEKKVVRDQIPDYVWECQKRFSVCPDCGRVYWAGTHLEGCRKDLEGLLAIETIL